MYNLSYALGGTDNDDGQTWRDGDSAEAESVRCESLTLTLTLTLTLIGGRVGPV